MRADHTGAGLLRVGGFVRLPSNAWKLDRSGHGPLPEAAKGSSTGRRRMEFAATTARSPLRGLHAGIPVPGRCVRCGNSFAEEVLSARGSAPGKASHRSRAASTCWFTCPKTDGATRSRRS